MPVKVALEMAPLPPLRRRTDSGAPSGGGESAASRKRGRDAENPSAPPSYQATAVAVGAAAAAAAAAALAMKTATEAAGVAATASAAAATMVNPTVLDKVGNGDADEREAGGEKLSDEIKEAEGEE